MRNWGICGCAVAALVICLSQVVQANPQVAEQSPEIVLNDSGDGVVGSIFFMHEMGSASNQWVLQSKQDQEWVTIGDEWEAVLTVEMPSGSGREDYEKNIVEGPCPSEGSHEFRLAYVDGEGEAHEFHTETLNCLRAGGDADTTEVDTLVGGTDTNALTDSGTKDKSDTDSAATDQGLDFSDESEGTCSAAPRRDLGITWMRLVISILF